MQLNIACAALIVGFVIGLTGMGGGALMTPVLVILFHVNPTAAISSDVLASVVLKPIGGGVHARRGTVNWRLVRWLAVGSVPAAFAGAYVISRVTGPGADDTVKHILGWVLLVAAAGMFVKTIVQTRRRALPTGERMDTALVRPIPTALIGLAPEVRKVNVTTLPDCDALRFTRPSWPGCSKPAGSARPSAATSIPPSGTSGRRSCAPWTPTGP